MRNGIRKTIALFLLCACASIGTAYAEKTRGAQELPNDSERAVIVATNLDSGNEGEKHKRMAELLTPILACAQAQGHAVTVMSWDHIGESNHGIVDTGESGAAFAWDQIANKRVNRDDIELQYRALVEWCDQSVSDAVRTDLYVAGRFRRDAFAGEWAELLDRHTSLNLHFIWIGKPEEATAYERELCQRYRERVQSVQLDTGTGDEQALRSQMEAYQREQLGTAFSAVELAANPSEDGKIEFEAWDMPAWQMLRVAVPREQVEKGEIRLIGLPDREARREQDEERAVDDGQTLCFGDSGEAWICLPPRHGGTYALEWADAQENERKNEQIEIQSIACIPLVAEDEIALHVVDEAGTPLEEIDDWHEEEHTLLLSTSLAQYVQQEGIEITGALECIPTTARQSDDTAPEAGDKQGGSPEGGRSSQEGNPEADEQQPEPDQEEMRSDAPEGGIHEGASAQVIAVYPDEADEGGRQWKATIPAEWQKGDEVRLTFRLSVQGAVLDSLSRTIGVINRAPVYREDDVRMTVYCDDLAGTDEAMAIDLNRFFDDEDASDRDSLHYELASEAEGIRIDGQRMVVERRMAGSDEAKDEAEWDVTVTAEDDRGGSCSGVIRLTYRSVRGIVQALRMEPVDHDHIRYVRHQRLTSDGKVSWYAAPTSGEGLSIRFRLEEEGVEAYEQARAQIDALPELGEALKITYNQQHELTSREAEDGTLGFSMDGFEMSSDRQTLTFGARLLVNGQAYPLNDLMPQIEMEIDNTPPALASGVEAAPKARHTWMNGAAGRREMMTLGDVFGAAYDRLVVADLFTDAQTPDSMEYRVMVSGEHVVLEQDGQELYPAEVDGEGRRIYHLNVEQSRTPLVIRYTDIGRAGVSIQPVDPLAAAQEGDQAAVEFKVKLSSRHTRNLVIAAVCAVLLLVAGFAAVVLVRRSMPSFDHVQLLISHVRETDEGTRWYGETRLDMSIYEKESVSLATLMAASGQLPPAALPAQVLAGIHIMPGRRGCVKMTVNKHVPVRIAIGRTWCDDCKQPYRIAADERVTRVTLVGRRNPQVKLALKFVRV